MSSSTPFQTVWLRPCTHGSYMVKRLLLPKLHGPESLAAPHLGLNPSMDLLPHWVICALPQSPTFSDAFVSWGRRGPVTMELPPSISHGHRKPFLLPVGRHSSLTLRKQWPVSLDMQSNSKWLCSASPSPNQVRRGYSYIPGQPKF